MLKINSNDNKKNKKIIQKIFTEEEFEKLLDSSKNFSNELIIIGTGSYADVYSFKDKYAIKKIKNNICQGFDCIAEILILSNLSKYHNNIIKGRGIFLYDNSLFLAMDKAEMSLDQFKFQSDESKDHVVQQIVSGVDFLHENNYLHLDLSRKNILVSYDTNKIKIFIADFSLSCKTETLSTYSKTSKISPFYRPYENLKGSTIYTNYSDLWSLGIIIYEIYNNLNIENIISNVTVDGEYNPEISMILHIEKCISWELWPYNSLLQINPSLRLYSGIKNRIPAKIKSNEKIYLNFCQNFKRYINNIFISGDYNKIDPNIKNWNNVIYYLIYCLYESPNVVFNIIRNDGVRSMDYLLKHFISFLDLKTLSYI